MLNVTWWLAGVNALAVFALGALRLDWPSAEFWADSRPYAVVALAITAAVPFIQATLARTGERSRARQLERQRDIETCLTGSLIYCVKHAGVNWLHVGIQAFAVKGRWPRARHQERVGKVRLRPVAVSGVVWEKGKGVIGRCWATHAPQYVDLEQHFAEYASYDRSRWDALPSDIRFGLSYEDFQRLRGKYGVIAAVPIKDARGRYLGCVTADTAPSDAGASAPARDEILQSLATTADLVAALLKR